MAQKISDLPTTVEDLKREELKVRQELNEARLAHSLQKLKSTATLRRLRVRLAHVLTMQNKGKNGA